MRTFAFSPTIGAAVLAGTPSIVQRGLQVLAGHERDACRQLHLSLRGEGLGTSGLTWTAPRNVVVSAAVSTQQTRLAQQEDPVDNQAPQMEPDAPDAPR